MQQGEGEVRRASSIYFWLGVLLPNLALWGLAVLLGTPLVALGFVPLDWLDPEVDFELRHLLLFISYLYVHADFSHMATNLCFLMVTWSILSCYHSSRFILVIYLLTGVGAALSHTYSTIYPQLPLIGASGAVWGVMGYVLARFPSHPLISFKWGKDISLALPSALLIVPLLLVNILNSNSLVEQVSNISFYGHVGGALSGMALAWFHYMNPSKIDS